MRAGLAASTVTPTSTAPVPSLANPRMPPGAVSDPPGAAAPRLNLLVITLDTMRADALGAYGAADGATPNLDRLARSGVVFDHAIAAAPLTLPAHVSLFTAKYPPRHGVRDNGGFVL